MSKEAEEQEQFKQALEALASESDSSIRWLIIHLARAVKRKQESKPDSYDLRYVRIHLDKYIAKG